MNLLSPERIQQIKSEADLMLCGEVRLRKAYDLVEELVFHAEDSLVVMASAKKLCDLLKKTAKDSRNTLSGLRKSITTKPAC